MDMKFRSYLQRITIYFLCLRLFNALGAPLSNSERTSLFDESYPSRHIFKRYYNMTVRPTYNESAHGARSTNTNSILLSEDQKDPCLQKLSNKARAECIQPLLETYYGPFFSFSCPFLPIQLAQGSCTGCPWDKINASSIQRRNLAKVLLPRKYFHEAKRTCSVANHVMAYKTSNNVNKYVYKAGLIVGLFVLFVSSFGVYSGPRHGISAPISTLSFHISEPAYLSILFVTYNLSSIIHLISHDYFLYCESLASSLSQYGMIELVYATVLFISVSRCLRLPSGPRTSDCGSEESSWMSYAIDVLRDERCTKKEYILAGFVMLLPCTLPVIYIVENTVNYEIGDPVRVPYCVAGRKDYAMAMIQFSKILLEFISVVIYAFGPQRRQFLFWLRYISLAIVMLLSWIVFLLMFSFTGLYKPYGQSMLIPRALDQDIAYDFVEIAHTTLVALLGLLEPLRFQFSRKHENLQK